MRSNIKTKRPRRVRLSGKTGETASDTSAMALKRELECVVQNSIRISAGRRGATYVGDLESLTFLKCLTSQVAEIGRNGQRCPPELLLFAKPIGLFEFRLQERQYVCIDHSRKEKDASAGEDEPLVELSAALLDRLLACVTESEASLASKPTNEELLSVLLTHLAAHDGTDGRADASDEDAGHASGLRKVHPRLRASIRNWVQRSKTDNQKNFKHRDETLVYHAYPLVDAVVLDNAYLAVHLVSPLDPNFLDERVADEHRVSEVTFGLFDVRNLRHTGVLDTAIASIKGAFSRVLFTNMMEQNSQALAAMFGELGTISREWVKIASNGIGGLLGQEFLKERFDTFRFGQAIVEKVLCPDFPDIDIEVYPFDRVLIFKEAGTIGQFRDKPIEMLVLEASILSNKPGDRGIYLTQRERLLRGTSEFQCDAAKKRIVADKIRRFYVHRSDHGLVLSRQQSLSDEQKSAIRGESRSSVSSGADRRAFEIGRPEREKDKRISTAVHNLLGRLFPDSTERRTDRTGRRDGEEGPQLGFTEDFEKNRLRILQRFDSEGIYFDYEHGMNLRKEAPILYALQQAYFQYLDHREPHDRPVDVAEMDTARESSKVVYISFCPTLHRENSQLMLGDKSSGREMQSRLLGREYTYTIVLIDDEDREKSQAQLKAEREDLKQFFEILMQQIWIDKSNEYQHLNRKLSIVENAMGAALHRARNLLDDPRKKEEIAEFQDRLRPLFKIGQTTTDRKIADSRSFLAELQGESEQQQPTWEDARKSLMKKAESWFPGKFTGANAQRIELLTTEVPRSLVRWSDAVITDAFYVMLKNACEAALIAEERNQVNPRIQVHFQASRLVIAGDTGQLFLEAVIENTGGPIPPSRLAALNAVEPVRQKPDEVKEEHTGTSTGIGVYLSRMQLHDVIGRGADLVIDNVGQDRVQARLVLPAEYIVDEAEEEEERPASTAPTTDYVLYVEDDPGIYGPNVAWLQGVLSTYGLGLAHRRSYHAAVEACESRLPRLALCDLQILAAENDASASEVANGIELVQAILREAEKQEVRPPIWLLTGESESTVREMLPETTSFGYRLAFGAADDAREMAAEGTIRLLKDKHPQHLAILPDVLPILQAPSPKVKDPMRDDRSLVAPVAMAATDWREKLADEMARDKYSPDRVVVVECDAPDMERLEEALRWWFTHEGLPDAKPLRGRDGLYKLNNHPYHKQLVLVIHVDEAFLAGCSIQFLYWGLSKNLWFVAQTKELRSIARAWLDIYHEAKGPLSKLRHDLGNSVWDSTALQEIRKTVREEIEHSESRLNLEHRLPERISAALSLGASARSHLEAALKRPEEVANDRSHVRERLHRLIGLLRDGARLDHSLEAFAIKRRICLLKLDEYLGGS